jgi:hypothetical protein
MKRLHKRANTALINVEPNEGERTLLCSSKGGIRSPSLDFIDTSSDAVAEDMILDQLAGIISNIYLKEIYGKPSDKKGCNLLQGLD